MHGVRMALTGAAALLCAAGNAQAFTHHPSTRAERAETRALNEQQLELAKDANATLALNASSTATDASAGMADNSPPAAAPTKPVQQASVSPTSTASSQTEAAEVQPHGSGPTSSR